MKHPKKMIFGLTWVGWLNKLILQFFCIRLAYGKEWKIIKWIVPLTGWGTIDYKYIDKTIAIICISLLLDLICVIILAFALLYTLLT